MGIKDRLFKCAKLYTENWAKDSINCIGKDTFELIKECCIEKEQEMKDKLDEACQNWKKTLSDASAFFQTQKPTRK